MNRNCVISEKELQDIIDNWSNQSSEEYKSELESVLVLAKTNKSKNK